MIEVIVLFVEGSDEMKIVLLVIMSLLWPFMTIISIQSISKHTNSFGVAIPRNQLKHLQIVKAKYHYIIHQSILGITFLISTLAIVVYSFNLFWFCIAASLPLYLLAHAFIYRHVHNKIKALKIKMGWHMGEEQIRQEHEVVKREKLSSRGWYTLPIIMIGINVLVVAINYNHIPDQFPIHYVGGEVNRVAEKSLGNVFTTNIIQIIFSLTMIGVQEFILRTKSIHAQKRNYLIYVHIITLAFILFFAVLQLIILKALNPWIVDSIFFPLVFVVLLFTLLFSIKSKDSNKSKNENTSLLDDCWRWGLVYVNRNDPSVFVERRYGTGWTINLGRATGWIILILMIVLTYSIAFLFTIFT